MPRNALANSAQINRMYGEKLAREMTHRPFQPPDLGPAKAMIDMAAQEAFPAYGFARSGQDMFESLGKGDLGWAALAGLGMLPGIPGITAFHGTPHRFAPTAGNPLGEFDAAKIGTGEGAQAYGSGLYFAEEPAVASDYARNLTMQQKGLGTLDGVRPTSKVEQQSLADLKLSGGDVQKALSRLSKPSAGYEEAYAARRKILQDVAGGTRTAQLAKGNLYKVDIPDEHVEKMLDWDKPFHQQPQGVQNAVCQLLQESGHLRKGEGGPRQLTSAWKAWKQQYAGMAESDGEAIYRAFAAGQSRDAGPVKASETLRKAGIPGLKYLDQGSRGTKGGGTHNFVVFDPAIAKILGRE